MNKRLSKVMERPMGMDRNESDLLSTINPLACFVLCLISILIVT